MAEPRSAAQEAADPSTSPQRLLELAEKHPQLHRLLVLNPSCPDVALQWILATDPWAKQAYEASRGGDADEGAADTNAAGEEDAAEISVWGDLGSAPSPTPPPAPGPTDSARASGVRIAQDAPVVPLGPATSPAAAEAPWSYDAPPAPGAYDAAPAYTAAAQPAPRPAQAPEQDDEDHGSRRGAWYACGGCLLLALVLVLAAVFVGRAWLSDDDEEAYQRDSSTTAAEPTPTEEPDDEDGDEPSEEESEDPVSPAPEDAHEMTELSSPTGNISCRLEEDSAACSVVERDFGEAGLEDCDSGPFSIQVADDEAGRACGSSFLSDSGQTLEYDESATYGDMACTSRFDGMTCWNTLTGKGFMVNRATYETF